MNEHTVTIIELLVIGIIYFIPAVVAFARDIRQRYVIALLNIVIGWTLIGWLILFFWANLADTRAAELT
ncbi:MAG: superinfection immunity protein [Alphaproteobacteria bacterium]|nr:superinfection immunity protein [Alphaproteobacteria bacterium]